MIYKHTQMLCVALIFASHSNQRIDDGNNFKNEKNSGKNTAYANRKNVKINKAKQYINYDIAPIAE